MNYNGNITLNANATGELRNAYIERLTSAQEDVVAQSLNLTHHGRLVFNVTTGTLKFWNGTTFTAIGAGNAAATQDELDRLEAALGAFINSDGTFNASAFSSLVNIDASSATDLLGVIEAIDQAITDAGGVGALAGLSDVAIASPVTGQVLRFNATSGKWENKKLDLADINGVSVTSDELNTLGGATSNIQSQLNSLDGRQDTSELLISQHTSDINALLDASDAQAADITQLQTDVSNKLDKSGGTMTGELSMGGFELKSLAAPTAPTSAVRQIDLDNAVAGITKDWQADVQGLETDFVGVAGRYIYVDGSTFVEGSFSPTANDIVTVDASGNVTGIAFDSETAGPGSLAWNIHAASWYQWNGTNWSSFGGLSGVNAGIGLLKSGNTLSVALGAGIGELPSGFVGIALKAANSGLALVDPTSGSASTANDAVLSIKVDPAALDLSSFSGFTSATSVVPLVLNANGISINSVLTSFITDMRTRLDAEVTNRQQADFAIITGAGLDSSGAYTAPTGTNYLSAATSLKNADVLLDARIKVNADAIATKASQSEVDNIETAVGLNTDGTLTPFSGTNYIDGQTIKQAAIVLDAQVKSNTDAISTKASSTIVSNILTGGGFEANGSYVAPTGTNYLGTATSLKNADVLLDTQIKAVSVATGNKADLTEVNAIETSVGLNSDGTFIPFSGTNYVDAATSIANAIDVLDDNVKTLVTALLNSLNKTHYVTSFSNTGATAAINVTHNLGQKFCNVMCVGTDDITFMPDSIKFVNANTLQVTLTSDSSGTIIVSGHATLSL